MSVIPFYFYVFFISVWKVECQSDRTSSLASTDSVWKVVNEPGTITGYAMSAEGSERLSLSGSLRFKIQNHGSSANSCIVSRSFCLMCFRPM